LIKASSIPYTIIRATQFFEFIKGITDFSTEGNKVRMPTALIQPMAADDVASAVGLIATVSPVNGTVEIGGRKSFASMNSSGNTWPQTRIRARLSQTRRRVTTAQTLARGPSFPAMARLSETRFETWLTQPAAKAAAVAH
jgi:uncharacterized protein YbjT (DUF2867 family)